jgi:hypothetical protein
MKIKTLALFTALVCAWLVGVPRAALANGDNILKDPGFELQLAPDQGGWILFDESRFASDNARSGQYSMFNWGFSQNVAFPPFVVGTVSGSYQEFPATPGSRWRMTGFGVAPNAIKGASAFGIVQLSFFDAAGNDLGTVETVGGKAKARTSNQLNAKTPAGKWILLDTGIATAPAATATVQAFTLYVDYSGSGISQGVYFDDLSLCALGEDDDGQSGCGDTDS